jgi:putative glutamine amidotransferase
VPDDLTRQVRRPVIGVTAAPLTLAGRATQFVHRDYLEAVAGAGGTALIIPTSGTVEPAGIVRLLDGVVLTGGGDVTPRRYGQEVAPETGGIDPGRDAAELALLAAALDWRTPLLAICRGCQLLNVAMGGSLHQQLPAGTGVEHMVPDRRAMPVHGVTLDPDSVLAAALGAIDGGPIRLGVNSVHHQGIDRLGAGLREAAWSDDGLVEGVVVEDHPVLGVQWHPENMRDAPPQRELFGWLVAQSARHLGPRDAPSRPDELSDR